MIAPIDEGKNTFWVDGLPSHGLRNPRAFPGKNTFWMNGNSGGTGTGTAGAGSSGDGNLFTLSNADTGKFFLLFE